MAGLVVAGLPVVWRTFRGVLAGRFAADLVAMLAITAAVLLRQPLAGLIVVLMQTGGEALERYAEGRASQAVRELERAAPHLAHRIRDDQVEDNDQVEDIEAEAIQTGDELLVRPGELVPCDAVVIKGRSHVDTSRITGEPLPMSAAVGSRIASGYLNLEGPLGVRATAPAGESQYARIVELVRTAQASKAPLQRLADRYALWFTPLTLLVCAAAYLLSRDPIRVLAVLVVATPCPLILATPVAVIGGIVSDEDNVRAVFKEVAETIGSITVLVNNAGIAGVNKPTHEITEAEWDALMAVNVKGVFFCTKHGVPYMKAAGGGSIVNLSSIYGLVSAPDNPPYHASKGAVRLMSKTDALLYAPDRIRVNSVHPGFIWTPMVEGYLRSSGDVAAGRAALDSLHPLGHIGEPDDIGYAILYLASEESKFVTGSELVVDGGLRVAPSKGPFVS